MKANEPALLMPGGFVGSRAAFLLHPGLTVALAAAPTSFTEINPTWIADLNLK